MNPASRDAPVMTFAEQQYRAARIVEISTRSYEPWGDTLPVPTKYFERKEKEERLQKGGPFFLINKKQNNGQFNDRGFQSLSPDDRSLLQDFSRFLLEAIKQNIYAASPDSRMHHRGYNNWDDLHNFIIEQCIKTLVNSKDLKTFLTDWRAAKDDLQEKKL